MQTRKRAVVCGVLFPLLTGIAVFLIAAVLWATSLWSNLNVDEILIQLTTSVKGTGNGMIGSFIRRCVLPGAATMAGVALLLVLLRRVRFWNLLARIGAGAGLAGIVGICVYAFFLYDVGGYIESNVVQSEYLEANYVDPKSVQLTFPEEKRNLIYIWLESMESTYTDTEHGGAFDFDPIPELTALAAEGVNFSGDRDIVHGGFVTYGTTWTAGALFAQTSGLPLKIPVADSAMDQQEHFFTGVTAIGDILADAGYHQALLIGSDAVFGGRRNYFTQHGGYEIWDYKYSKEQGQIPEDYRVFWGYEDEKLFDFARQHLTELAASDEPFNLSILTVDTHFPDGYVCRNCGDEFGDDQYSNVMACSSRQVTEFIEWCREQPFYENTTIVLSGDHLTMDVDYCDAVDADYPRRVYTVYLNAAAEVKDPDAYREYTTLDNFPTTLAAMGVQIEGERLGLGVNLFSGEQTLYERDGLEVLNRELRRKSEFLNSLSGISEEVFEMSEQFLNTHVELSIDFGADSLTYTLGGLSEIEQDFSSIEVFAEKMFGERRSTMWYEPAVRQDDGTYTITMPLSALSGETSFTVHFYAMTTAGRIKVDKSFQCDVAAETLTYTPDSP